MNSSLAPSYALGKSIWPESFRFLKGKKNPAEILDQSDELMNLLMHEVYLGKFPVLQDANPEDEYNPDPNIERFLVKKSYVPHEWGIRGDDIAGLLPYIRPSLLQEIYENPKSRLWTNEDDFRFYEYISTYNGAKIRIIFHNCIDSSGKKMSFKDWITQGEYGVLRICLS